MRILILHDYGTLHGGAEIMAVALRDALRARGHGAALFASRARRLPLPNVADVKCLGSTGPARRVLQVWNPWAVRALRSAVRSFRPDVVHVRMFMTQLSPAILPVLKDVPTVVHVVNHDLVCPLTTRVLPDGTPCTHRPGRACGQAGCVGVAGVARTVVQQALLRRGLEAVDAVVANSEATRDVLVANGIRVRAVVWNGVPRTEARPPLTDPPAVYVAGRLVPEKGVDVLLEAMARVRDAVPEARLRVAGDGPARPALERRAAAPDLEGAVEFLGHRPRAGLEPVAGQAWVQAVPSRWAEPFGIVAAEAMMRGTAVVASDTGGLRELVDAGVTGLRVPPGDADALAQALVGLLTDRARAERLGAAGRAFALERLTEERMVDAFLDLYSTLVGSAAGVHAS